MAAAVTPCLSEESNGGGAIAMPLVRSTSGNNNNGNGSNGRHRIVGDGMVLSANDLLIAFRELSSVRTAVSQLLITVPAHSTGAPPATLSSRCVHCPAT